MHTARQCQGCRCRLTLRRASRRRGKSARVTSKQHVSHVEKSGYMVDYISLILSKRNSLSNDGLPQVLEACQAVATMRGNKFAPDMAFWGSNPNRKRPIGLADYSAVRNLRPRILGIDSVLAREVSGLHADRLGRVDEKRRIDGLKLFLLYPKRRSADIQPIDTRAAKRSYRHGDPIHIAAPASVA